MSKIGKTTTNMHRAFHVRKQFEPKEENVLSVESENDEPPGIGISEIKAAQAAAEGLASGNDKKTIDLASLDYEAKGANKNKLSYKMGLVEKEMKITSQKQLDEYQLKAFDQFMSSL